MSTTVQVVVDKRSFDRFQFALNEFRLATGISMRDGFIREAGYCCYEFMRYSPSMSPSGGKGLMANPSKKTGEQAVANDIMSIFRPAEDPGVAFQKMGDAVIKGDLGSFLKWQAVARSSIRTKTGLGGHTWYRTQQGRDPRGIFLAILLNNNPQKDFQAFKNRFGSSFAAKEPPKETTDLAGIHRRFKQKYKGRILENGGPNLRNKYIVRSDLLEAYIKKKQRLVGYLKAGWANTLLALPKPKDYGADVQFASTSKVPKWITRNIGSRGYANFNGNQNTGNFTLVIGNQIGDNDGVATKASTINHVLSVRANKLDKEVMRRLGPYIRAFNAKN